MASDSVRGNLNHQPRLHAVTHLTVADLRKHDQMEIDITSVEDIMADYPEVMGVWPNPTLATVIALCRDVQAKTFNACEAVARLHQTYALPDFPPAFGGGYRGAAQNIGDAIAALKDKA